MPAPLHVSWIGHAVGPCETKRQLSPSAVQVDWWFRSAQKVPVPVQAGSEGALQVQDCVPAVPVHVWRPPHGVGPAETTTQVSAPAAQVVTELPAEQNVPDLPPTHSLGAGLHAQV